MKKQISFLILFLILFPSLLGCQAAGAALQSPLSTSKDAAAGNDTQKNYLVMDLEQNNGKPVALVSMWVVFIKYQDPAFIMFKPLFPSGNKDQDAELFKHIQVNASGVPTQAFMDYLHNAYQLDLSGYVVVDSSAIATFGQWAGDPSSENSNQLTTQTIQSFCGQQDTSHNLAANLGHMDQLSGHIKTNLDLADILSRWGNANPPGSKPHCEILP
jgi:hypothetical protein